MGQHGHYIHSHRLAAEMWTAKKNNLLGKKFLSCSYYLYRFRKYVSYGFPAINFCNPGVHYGTPCITKWLTVQQQKKFPSDKSNANAVIKTAFISVTVRSPSQIAVWITIMPSKDEQRTQNGGQKSGCRTRDATIFRRDVPVVVNPLQTKRRPLYLKPQSVPRCKHFSSLL
jgi:hypothetical protein